MTAMLPTSVDADSLITAHLQADLIRRIRRTAYRAFSWTHKNGLDGLSLMLGFAAPMGFALAAEHREQQGLECREAVEQLLRQLPHSVADRRVVALLLAGYPARDSEIAAMLKAHLSKSD